MKGRGSSLIPQFCFHASLAMSGQLWGVVALSEVSNILVAE